MVQQKGQRDHRMRRRVGFCQALPLPRFVSLMAYRLRLDQPVAADVRRIAHEQLDKALEELSDDGLGLDTTVHQVRKRCKKLRGLVRLVRPALGATYAEENARYRDAARRLSDLRDTAALIGTYDALMEHFAGQVDRRGFAPIRRALTLQRKAEASADASEQLAAFRADLEAGRAAISGWSLDDEGFEAVRGGLEKTYGRARRALSVAYDDPTDAHFHDWRKRVKYHWYHTRLLRAVWKPVMQTRRQELKRLSDLLGDDHDFAVFRQALTGDPERFGRIRQLQAFIGLLDRRRAELQAHARPLGKRLFTEPADALGERIEGYWNAPEYIPPHPELAEQHA